ncbi:nitrite reductase small subunit NirD [Chengkuizengella axinellae]|uniref:Nitrite reductase small subunit NirD n=1 Tax=Chengkuizengella axinellae TaxID=3064388 RepID=A0ABT9J0V1_9BACL|nr:nitrite reductase small subunit NirD [Chengkuizengella sp. 2205SS18-9]MDP5275042.1 nitrite reductase small subunit NirD [Chengkuizengella sp. 2205SS18-9]
MGNLKGDNSWVEVAKYDDLPVNSGKTVRFKDKELAVFRLTSGKILAIENRCPHKDGVLAEGIVSGEYVFCPLHDRKIDLTSGLVQLPDTGCVETFDVSVEDGKVYIALLEKSEIAAVK